MESGRGVKAVIGIPRMMRAVTVAGAFARVSVVTLSVVGVVAPTRAGAANATSYTITDIGASAPHDSSYSIAMNDHGDVVGQIQGARSLPFLFRSGRMTVLTPPKTFGEAIVRDVNNRDSMTVNAQDASGESAAFVVRPSGKGFTWIRLSLGRLRGTDVSVEGVAANGDVDGDFTMYQPRGMGQFRSVIWRAEPRGSYAPAELLPMSGGFNLSIAGGIWRQGHTTYVGGAQSNGVAQYASLWSPTPTLTRVQDELPFVSSIGGTQHHVYASGTSWTPNSSQAWVGTVTFGRSGVASVKSLQLLFPVPGYSQAVGTGVAGDRGGAPVVVGDVLQGDTIIRGAEWRDGKAFLVQSLISSESPWTVTETGGINQRLQIAGQGEADGHYHALLLTPPKQL